LPSKGILPPEGVSLQKEYPSRRSIPPEGVSRIIKHMKILAIDPGYEKVGYAIFEKQQDKHDKDFTFIASDLIKTSPKNPHEVRLKEIFDSLDKIVKTHKIDLLVLEQLFIFKNQKTVLKVAQAIGAIELVAAQNNLLIERLTPLQIKQIITGYGNADKLAVKKMIDLTLTDKVKVKDDDESDAIACGLAYCFTFKF
jgi:crossover junction endodeoxyribonuclease RuvC